MQIEAIAHLMASIDRLSFLSSFVSSLPSFPSPSFPLSILSLSRKARDEGETLGLGLFVMELSEPDCADVCEAEREKGKLDETPAAANAEVGLCI